jgi:alpha-beta hydrolase superfamily lysophospholipase
MILHASETEQIIDRDERGRFVKELVLTRFAGVASPQPIPLAMVRKRLAGGQGTCAPVLLIHGYGQNRYAWHLPSRSLSGYLARAGFDVFNLDLRGHGRSRHLGARRPSHVAEFIREDVPAAIEEVQRLSGGRRVFILGHSLGGLIGYAVAPSLRGAVAGVATLGSPYHFTRGSLSLRLLGGLMLAVDRRMSLGHFSVELNALGEAMRLARVFIESPIFPLPIRGFAPGSMEPWVLGQHMALAMDQGSVTVLRNMFLSAAESRQSGHKLGGLSGFAEAFEALDVPLLVVSGTLDDLAPPESVEPAFTSSRSTDKTYRAFPRGHIDILMGRDAPLTIWPLIDTWMTARAEGR